MSKYEHLFSPLKIAGITVKNRYAVGPMGANYLYGEKGCYTEDGVDYILHAGDAEYCSDGHTHAVVNHTDKPATFLAIVIK